MLFSFHILNAGLVIAFTAAKLAILWGALNGGAAFSGAYRTYAALVVLLMLLGSAMRAGRVARIVVLSADYPARLMPDRPLSADADRGARDRRDRQSSAAVDALKDRVGAAFVADGSDPSVLESVGAKEMDVAVVTYGEDFEATVLLPWRPSRR